MPERLRRLDFGVAHLEVEDLGDSCRNDVLSARPSFHPSGNELCVLRIVNGLVPQASRETDERVMCKART